jgi:hypothetical protein
MAKLCVRVQHGKRPQVSPRPLTSVRLLSRSGLVTNAYFDPAVARFLHAVLGFDGIGVLAERTDRHQTARNAKLAQRVGDDIGSLFSQCRVVAAGAFITAFCSIWASAMKNWIRQRSMWSCWLFSSCSWVQNSNMASARAAMAGLAEAAPPMSAFTRRLRAAPNALAAFFRCGRASTCSGACGWPLAAVIARMAKTSEFS